MCLMTVNGKPRVRGPEYTAGANAMNTDSDSPSDGIMPRAGRHTLR